MVGAAPWAKPFAADHKSHTNGIGDVVGAKGSSILNSKVVKDAEHGCGVFLARVGKLALQGLQTVGGWLGECAAIPFVGASVPHDLLIFPDRALPCRSYVQGGQCRRSGCEYAHEETSLMRLLNEFKQAHKSIEVCVFNITLDEISDVLIDCSKRGVRVRLITDDEQQGSQGSDVQRIAKAGVQVRNDNSEWLMHHKFAVVDGHTLLSGSFNYTRSAVLQNRENVLVMRSWRLAHEYRQLFETLWSTYAHNEVA